MGRNQNQQNQQPQIPSLDLLEVKAVGKIINVSVQAKLGNKPFTNQVVKLLYRKVGEVDYTDKNITKETDHLLGRASLKAHVETAGSYEVEVQAVSDVRAKRSEVVSIAKDAEPEWLVSPFRNGNKITFLVTGPANGVFSYNFGEEEKTGKLNKKGSKEIYLDLESKKEYETRIYVSGKPMFKRTFFRYELEETNKNGLWVSLASIILLVWSLPFLFPSYAINHKALVVLLSVVGFFGFAFTATQTKFNNMMAFSLGVLTAVSWWMVFSQPFGESPFNMLVRFLYESSDQLRRSAFYNIPEVYSGSGSWLWFFLAILFTAKLFVFFAVFTYWDEVLGFIRKRAEEWSQRPFSMSNPEKNSIIPRPRVSGEQNDKPGFMGFVERTVDKFDEAIIAGVGWDLVYKWFSKKR